MSNVFSQISNEQNIYYLLFYFFIFSFLGWLMETIIVSCDTKKFVNRGFLLGPFCPIYGVGMCLVISFLTPVRDNLLLVFLLGMVIASTIEYITSYFLEIIFHAKWWDYSQHKFNFNGRISLPISLAWGALSLLMIELIVPFFKSLIDSLNHQYGQLFLMLFSLVIVSDTIITLYNLINFNKILAELSNVKSEISEKFESNILIEKAEGAKNKLENMVNDFLQDNNIFLDEVSEQISGKLNELKSKYKFESDKYNGIQKRLLKAFPNLRPTDKHRADIVEELRKIIKQRKKNN